MDLADISQRKGLLGKYLDVEKKKEIFNLKNQQSLYEKNIFYEKGINWGRSLIFRIIFLIFLATVITVLHITGKEDNFSKFLKIISLKSLFFSLITIILLFIGHLLCKNKQKKIQYKLFYNNYWLIIVLIHLVALMLFTSFFKTFGEIKEFLYDKNDVNNEIQNNLKFYQSFYYIIVCLNLITSSFLLKRLIGGYLNYRIQYKALRKRILENDNLTEFVNDLDNLSQAGECTDIDKYSSHLFRILSGKKIILEKTTFEELFPNKKEYFRYFDINKNGEIDQEEFIEIYRNILIERRNLRLSFKSMSVGIKKVELFLSIFLYIISFLIIGAAFISLQNDSNKFLYILGIAIIIIAYLVKPVVVNLFKSIIYVFFVRPFDINDNIGIEGEIFQVKKIGILYTDLIRNQGIYTISNVKLSTLNVKNYREVEYIEYKINRKFDIKYFDKLSEYKQRIRGYISENRNKYQNFFELKNIIFENNFITFDVFFRVNSFFQNILQSEKRKDEIAIVLFKIEEKILK